MNTLSVFTLSIFSLCFSISFSQVVSHGFSVELIHRDSSKSPFYKPTQNKYEHVINAARRSFNRINYFYKDSLASTPQSTVISAEATYLMNYSVGTPPFNLYGIVDTGSDIVWLQCDPCEQCNNQTTHKFNPSKSSTYKNIPCPSNLCQSVRDTSCNNKKNCEHSINYGDQSHSQGDLSVDTLTLESTSGRPVSFPKTVIGCGIDNTRSFGDANSSIVGLGGGPVSLITQLGSSIGGKFSYCLMHLSYYNKNRSLTSSKLNFGDAAIVSGEHIVSTPLVQKDNSSFYYLTLEAFSVDDKRVEYGGSSKDGGEGNIIIDSGTTLTLLPPGDYANLESAVVELVKLERADDPNKQFSLCYRETTYEFDFPYITAHFKGADVPLIDISSSFIRVGDEIICLAFASSQKNVAIFGSFAQQNYLVGYDLQQKTVSFKPDLCGEDED